jgi:hypothetical protein
VWHAFRNLRVAPFTTATTTTTTTSTITNLQSPPRADKSISARAAGGVGAGGRESELPLDQVVREFKRYISGGELVRDRKHRFKSYTNCFVGSEAVRELVSRGKGPAEEVVAKGQRLLEAGYIAHITRERPFRNDNTLYRFVDLEHPNTPPPPSLLRSPSAMAKSGGDSANAANEAEVLDVNTRKMLAMGLVRG